MAHPDRYRDSSLSSAVSTWSIQGDQINSSCPLWKWHFEFLTPTELGQILSPRKMTCDCWGFSENPSVLDWKILQFQVGWSPMKCSRNPLWSTLGEQPQEFVL
jgi:hypothetical protein